MAAVENSSLIEQTTNLNDEHEVDKDLCYAEMIADQERSEDYFSNAMHHILPFLWQYEMVVDGHSEWIPFTTRENMRIESQYNAIPFHQRNHGTSFHLDAAKKELKIFLNFNGHSLWDEKHGVLNKVQRRTEFQSEITELDLEYGVGYIKPPGHMTDPIMFSSAELKFVSDSALNPCPVGLQVRFQIDPKTLMAINIQKNDETAIDCNEENTVENQKDLSAQRRSSMPNMHPQGPQKGGLTREVKVQREDRGQQSAQRAKSMTNIHPPGSRGGGLLNRNQRQKKAGCGIMGRVHRPKDVMCRFFDGKNGSCSRGEHCWFKHEAKSGKRKAPLANHWDHFYQDMTFKATITHWTSPNSGLIEINLDHYPSKGTGIPFQISDVMNSESLPRIESAIDQKIPVTCKVKRGSDGRYAVEIQIVSGRDPSPESVASEQQRGIVLMVPSSSTAGVLFCDTWNKAVRLPYDGETELLLVGEAVFFTHKKTK